MLNITPLPHENWQARRNHIFVRWNTQTPYTFRFLIWLLDELTSGDFDVITNFDEYEMEIRVSTLDSGIIGDLAHIIFHIIPVNLDITSRNTIKIKIETPIAITSRLNSTKVFTIAQGQSHNISLVSPLQNTGRASQSKVFTIAQGTPTYINTKSEPIKVRSTVTQSNEITLSQGHDMNIDTTAQIQTRTAVTTTQDISITQGKANKVTTESKLQTGTSLVKIVEYII